MLLLYIEAHVLPLEDLGLERNDVGLLEVIVTIVGVNKRSRGHPRENMSKPKEELSASSPSSFIYDFSKFAPPFLGKGKCLLVEDVVVHLKSLHSYM